MIVQVASADWPIRFVGGLCKVIDIGVLSWEGSACCEQSDERRCNGRRWCQFVGADKYF